jgi:hypothetical protein
MPNPARSRRRALSAGQDLLLFDALGDPPKPASDSPTRRMASILLRAASATAILRVIAPSTLTKLHAERLIAARHRAPPEAVEQHAPPKARTRRRSAASPRAARANRLVDLEARRSAATPCMPSCVEPNAGTRRSASVWVDRLSVKRWMREPARQPLHRMSHHPAGRLRHQAVVLRRRAELHGGSSAVSSSRSLTSTSAIGAARRLPVRASIGWR